MQIKREDIEKDREVKSGILSLLKEEHLQEVERLEQKQKQLLDEIRSKKDA